MAVSFCCAGWMNDWAWANSSARPKPAVPRSASCWTWTRPRSRGLGGTAAAGNGEATETRQGGSLSGLCRFCQTGDLRSAGGAGGGPFLGRWSRSGWENETTGSNWDGWVYNRHWARMAKWKSSLKLNLCATRYHARFDGCNAQPG
jgi:hypothetical protein